MRILIFTIALMMSFNTFALTVKEAKRCVGDDHPVAELYGKIKKAFVEDLEPMLSKEDLDGAGDIFDNKLELMAVSSSDCDEFTDKVIKNYSQALETINQLKHDMEELDRFSLIIKEKKESRVKDFHSQLESPSQP